MNLVEMDSNTITVIYITKDVVSRDKHQSGACSSERGVVGVSEVVAKHETSRTPPP
jgi:hypothetical protein